MGTDLSTTEKLQVIADKSSRKIQITEIPYPNSVMDPVTYHRRTVYMPNDSQENAFFVCFGDSREFGKYANFSGVFFPVDTSLDDSLVIRKRDILDKLNSLFKENKFKTGISSFDAQVVTEANLKQRTFNIFSNANIQNLVLDSFKIDQRMKVGINEINIDFVPQLKGKSHFGIYITDDWIFDAQKIEKLFELAEKFRNLPELKVYLR